MSKTRNNRVSRRSTTGAAHKGSPSCHRRRFEVGERVRIVDISKALKDPKYDLKNSDSRETRTAELFRFCMGREFKVRGFQKAWVELEASDDPAVRRKFGKYHTIWIEPEFLELVDSTRKKSERREKTK
jgi:hypothetical protein